jgi:hypothetical protein
MQHFLYVALGSEHHESNEALKIGLDYTEVMIGLTSFE